MWRSVIEKRIPVRIGYCSDPLMPIERELGVTRELLRMLKFYRYPYLLTTKSNLVAEPEYLRELDPELCAVQISLVTTDPVLARVLEPGAPPPAERLAAVRELCRRGIWTGVRLTPLFPMYPDGTLVRNEALHSATTLGVFRWPMIAELASAGVPRLLTGFGSFTADRVDRISAALNIDFRAFFEQSEDGESYDFSAREKRRYYERIHALCREVGMESSVCYIGSSEDSFEGNRDLWHHRDDCCNIQGKVGAFVTDAQAIPQGERIRILIHSLLAAILGKSYV
jgi:DNA repair photolyase